MKRNFNIVEILLLLYLCFGMFKGISFLQYFDYIVSLIIQFFCWYYIKQNGNKVNNKQTIIVYIILILEIILIAMNFIYIDVEMIRIINRMLPLISVFGIIIIDCNKNVNIEKVIIGAKKFYCILGIILIINCLSFFLFSKAIWKPSIYLGYRFSGPFYDCNFLSICYSVMFILEVFDKSHKGKQKRIYLIIFLICILLGLSWSAILVMVIAFVLGNIFKGNNIILKQIFLLIIYFVAVIIINNYNPEIQNYFCNSIEKYTSLTKTEALVKYNSFYYRVVAQSQAIKLFFEKPIGYGPLQIVNHIGMDVHNSYVSFLFEMGILGFLLQITSCLVKTNISKRNNILCFYILLISFTINIHYSILYALLLIIIFQKNNKEVENLNEKKENIVYK